MTKIHTIDTIETVKPPRQLNTSMLSAILNGGQVTIRDSLAAHLMAINLYEIIQARATERQNAGLQRDTLSATSPQ